MIIFLNKQIPLLLVSYYLHKEYRQIWWGKSLVVLLYSLNLIFLYALVAVLSNVSDAQAVKQYSMTNGTQTPLGLYTSTPYSNWHEEILRKKIISLLAKCSGNNIS